METHGHQELNGVRYISEAAARCSASIWYPPLAPGQVEHVHLHETSAQTFWRYTRSRYDGTDTTVVLMDPTSGDTLYRQIITD